MQRRMLLMMIARATLGAGVVCYARSAAYALRSVIARERQASMPDAARYFEAVPLSCCAAFATRLIAKSAALAAADVYIAAAMMPCPVDATLADNLHTISHIHHARR